MQPGHHRETARILLHSRFEQVFLLLTHFDPEVQLPPRWITPGGGIDTGESIIEAAVRELFEETGLRVDPEILGAPVWSTSGRWDWGDGVNFHTYTDHFFQLDITSLTLTDKGLKSGLTAIDADRQSRQLDADSFQLDNAFWTEDEHRDVLEHKWWKIIELVESTEPIGPPELPNWLRSWL